MTTISNNPNVGGPDSPIGNVGAKALPTSKEPAKALLNSASEVKVKVPDKSSSLEKLANIKASAALGGKTTILRQPVAAKSLGSKQVTPTQIMPKSLVVLLKFSDITHGTSVENIQEIVDQNASLLKSNPDLLEAIVNQADDVRVIQALVTANVCEPIRETVLQKSWSLLADCIAGQNYEKVVEALSLFKSVLPEGDHSQRLINLAKQDSVADVYFNNPDSYDKLYVLCKEMASEEDKGLVREIFKAIVDPKLMLQGMVERKELDNPRNVHKLENLSAAAVSEFIEKSPEAGETLMKNRTIQDKFAEDRFGKMEHAANEPTAGQTSKTKKTSLTPAESINILAKLERMYEEAHFDKKSEQPNELTAADMKNKDLLTYSLYTKVIAKFDLGTDLNVLNDTKLLKDLKESEIDLQMLYDEHDPAITKALDEALSTLKGDSNKSIDEIVELSDKSLYINVYNASLVGDYSRLDDTGFIEELRRFPDQVQMLFDENDETIMNKLQAAGFKSNAASSLTAEDEIKNLFTEFGLMDTDNLPGYEKKAEVFDAEKYNTIMENPSVLNEEAMKEYLNTHNEVWIKLFAECKEAVSEAILDVGTDLASENNLQGNLCHGCHAVQFYASNGDLDQAQKEIDGLDPKFKDLPVWKDAQRAMNYAVSIKLLDAITDSRLKAQLKEKFQRVVDERQFDVPDPKEVKKLVEALNNRKDMRLITFLRVLAEFSPNLCQFTIPEESTVKDAAWDDASKLRPLPPNPTGSR